MSFLRLFAFLLLAAACVFAQDSVWATKKSGWQLLTPLRMTLKGPSASPRMKLQIGDWPWWLGRQSGFGFAPSFRKLTMLPMSLGSNLGQGVPIASARSIMRGP
jgi:hypothetical protein